MRILHVFYSTQPNTKGSDIRSRDIVESQKEIGLEVLACSSPFQPPSESGETIEYFSGIPHFRTFDARQRLTISENDKGIIVKIRKILKLFTFANRLLKIAKDIKPDIIHSHSTFFCAIAGYYVSRIIGVPFIYEVRSLWEERIVLKTPSLKNRLIASLIRHLETKCMRSADRVVAISQGLFDEIIARGIKAKLVTIAPNAVNISRITNKTISITNKPAKNWKFAYIGSLSEIEGLDLLIDAIRLLRASDWNNEFHIFGDGPASHELKKQAQNVKGIIFHGSFRQDEITKVYNSVDVIVNPRKQSKLTDTVTPLKPLEAMAWRKLVITSSVRGMQELVKHRDTGLVFKTDELESIVSILKNVIDQPHDMFGIIESGFQHVSQNRSWYKNAKTYEDLYRKLLK